LYTHSTRRLKEPLDTHIVNPSGKVASPCRDCLG
jgi:hypothetical protein